MTDKALPVLYRWKDRIKSEDGPRDPVLRFVALVLGDWCKDPARPAADVGVARLAVQIGLDERNVRVRIQQLEAGGWLAVDRRPGRRSVYRPLLPPAGAEAPSTVEIRAPDYPQPRAEAPGVCQDGTPGGGARTPRAEASGDPGRGRPDNTYHLPTSIPTGEGAGPVRLTPAGAPPGSDDDQLPLAARLLMSIRQGNRKGFDELCEAVVSSDPEAVRRARGEG